MTEGIDLTEQQARTVQEIVTACAPQHRVSVFGSRARGTARRFSDLDLLFSGERALSLRELGALDEAFDESDLPFRVDVVDAARTNPQFRQLIEAHLKPLRY